MIWFLYDWNENPKWVDNNKRTKRHLQLLVLMYSTYLSGSKEADIMFSSFRA